ncbi:maltose acetyltransferase domain-containing protein [Bifidobacterium vansinderenii]|uniref:maltose acetyltransferase domain-containing protein n=1 Tax=Bifidobacterium vansinderenii TaxID=1984871 RepID=UPI001E30398D|nr:maltose acetyltransferase domain-containing protein [Bifidobacterium vansinderenii]
MMTGTNSPDTQSSGMDDRPLTNVERKDAGLPYHYDDPAIMDGQLAWQEKLWAYNQTKPTEQEKRQRLLKDMCAEVGGGMPCGDTAAREQRMPPGAHGARHLHQRVHEHGGRRGDHDR